MKHFLATALLLASGFAQAAPLHVNAAQFVGLNGLSVLDTAAGNNTLGFTANNNFSVADNFRVSGNGWRVKSVDLFAYQTGGDGFSFTGATWQIRSGGLNGGLVVASGTEDAVSNGGSVGYRVTDTAQTATNRNIYRIELDIADIDLLADDYWLVWSLQGTSASGPFVPPLLDEQGNAQQGPAGGNFALIRDGGSQRTAELPFVLHGDLLDSGNTVPEPSTILLTAFAVLGMLFAGRRRSRGQTTV